ncbi:lipase, partial [Coprococcus eutactus]|nr:lipase [Coprococcus eutactus]
IDHITQPLDKSILFVLYYMTKYFDRERLKGFLNSVWRKFPGAEVVFDAKNSVAKRMWNINEFMGTNKGSMNRFSI